MPRGWQAYFDAKQAGRNYGIKIKCPHCGETPPATYRDRKLNTNKPLSHYRRIRWMMVHVAMHKAATLKGRFGQ